MSADDMNPAERSFYENTKMKYGYSMFLASIALVSLAFCAVYAGLADAARIYSDRSSGFVRDTYVSQSTGYGE